MANNFKEFIVDLFGDIRDSEGNLLSTVVGKEIAEVYYKELALATCTNLIANAISQCTCRTYENGEEVQGINYYILNVRPNINESSSMLWHKAVENMIKNGEALIVNIKGNLYVADSYHVDEYPVKGNIYSAVTVGTLSLTKKFKQDEVIVLRLNNTNVKRLIDNLYKSYGELLRYCIGKYKMDNQEKFILELDNVKVGDKMFNEKFRDVLMEQLGDFLNNQKAVLPLYKGQTLIDVSKDSNSSSDDFQLLVENLFKTVAQSFQIPLSLLFGNNADNINQTTKQFLTFCIEPIASMISEELSAKLYNGFAEFSQGNYIKLDTSGIRHVDILEMASAVDKILASGILTINEIRNIVGFNEIDEEYASILITDYLNAYVRAINENDFAENMLKQPQQEEGENIETDNQESENIIDENIQQTALNGAQIESLLSIITAVVSNLMDYEGAIALITNAFPFDEETPKK